MGRVPKVAKAFSTLKANGENAPSAKDMIKEEDAAKAAAPTAPAPTEPAAGAPPTVATAVQLDSEGELSTLIEKMKKTPSEEPETYNLAPITFKNYDDCEETYDGTHSVTQKAIVKCKKKPEPQGKPFKPEEFRWEDALVQVSSIPDCNSSSYPGCVPNAETASPWKHRGDPEIVDRSAGFVWHNPE